METDRHETPVIATPYHDMTMSSKIVFQPASDIPEESQMYELFQWRVNVPSIRFAHSTDTSAFVIYTGEYGCYGDQNLYIVQPGLNDYDAYLAIASKSRDSDKVFEFDVLLNVDSEKPRLERLKRTYPRSRVAYDFPRFEATRFSQMAYFKLPRACVRANIENSTASGLNIFVQGQMVNSSTPKPHGVDMTRSTAKINGNTNDIKLRLNFEGEGGIRGGNE